MAKKMRDYLQPKTVIYTCGDGFISKGITKAQDIYWSEFGKKSQWSHATLCGIDGFVYESTVEIKFVKAPMKIFKWKINVPQLKYVFGIKRSTQEKYYKTLKKEKIVGIQYNFLDIDDDQWKNITNKAIYLLSIKAKYGLAELAGTLKTYVQWKFTKDEKKREKLLAEKNPFDNNHAMYCVALVEECMEAGGVEYADPDIDNELLTVDHGWVQDGTPCSKKIFKNPKTD